MMVREITVTNQQRISTIAVDKSRDELKLFAGDAVYKDNGHVAAATRTSPPNLSEPGSSHVPRKLSGRVGPKMTPGPERP